MKYRMTIHPALEAGNHTVKFGFETAEQMIVAKYVAAGLLLFLQDTAVVIKDYSNVFFLEELVDGEWEEYEEFDS
jgi:hypothetical protein